MFHRSDLGSLPDPRSLGCLSDPFSSSCPTAFPLFLYDQVLQAQLSALLQGQEHIQSSCSFTEQALSHGSATEVGPASMCNAVVIVTDM